VLGLPQHPDEHRSQRSVLLAVDQQLGEYAALRVTLELSDRLGSLEVREHEDVQLGAWRGAERVEASELRRCRLRRESDDCGRVADPSDERSDHRSCVLADAPKGVGGIRALELQADVDEPNVS